MKLSLLLPLLALGCGGAEFQETLFSESSDAAVEARHAADCGQVTEADATEASVELDAGVDSAADSAEAGYVGFAHCDAAGDCACARKWHACLAGNDLTCSLDGGVAVLNCVPDCNTLASVANPSTYCDGGVWTKCADTDHGPEIVCTWP